MSNPMFADLIAERDAARVDAERLAASLRTVHSILDSFATQIDIHRFRDETWLAIDDEYIAALAAHDALTAETGE